ncbi:SRR1-like protein isoform X1 [Ostrinia furnacalis]|uniref:SRR1-like protein isoform X1 n=1 Tax=Ostrinia furnacalis TaxID=93504 RepID=UPI0010409D55|nr:SRR1-like protein isoform X1 [Ostrinia furnacalis]
MSKFEVDSDGFQIVKSKHSFKKPSKLPDKSLDDEKLYNINKEKLIKQIEVAVDCMKGSEYFEDAIKSVSTVVLDKPVAEIICLGLGHIYACNVSKNQLAFLLCLRDFCKPKRVLVHDPIFFKTECEVLQHFGLEVIPENNEGNYIISENDYTIAYLPHCPKQLTNNFLWANWDLKLQNCMIICNSFSSLIENNPSRLLLETVPYLHKIYPFTSEIVLQNNYTLSNVFNDTSIHYFPKEKLVTIPAEFWQKGSKPHYNNTEEFITSLMVEKLNI